MELTETTAAKLSVVIQLLADAIIFDSARQYGKASELLEFAKDDLAQLAEMLRNKKMEDVQ